MGRYRKVRIGKAEMRRKFCEAGLLDPEANGYTVYPTGRNPAGFGAPPDCVEEEWVEYLDRHGVKIADANLFYRADGSIGAGGEPDPNSLIENGTLYLLRGRKGRGR